MPPDEGDAPLVRAGAVAVIGPVFLDLVFADLNAAPSLGTEVYGTRFSIAPGGFAITAITLARLARPVLLASVVGEDVLSDVVLRTLAGEGVGVGPMVRYPDGLAITVAASTHEDRAFITHRGAAPVSAVQDAVSLALERQPAHIHLDAEHPEADRVFQWARQNGATVSLGMGWDPAFLTSAVRRGRAQQADLVAYNEREALMATGLSDVSEAVSRLAQESRAVLVTLGERGAIWQRGERRLTVPAVRARPVDVTGAGDVFLATLLAALGQGAPEEAALRAAARVAARAVERLGGASGVPRGPLRWEAGAAAGRGGSGRARPGP